MIDENKKKELDAAQKRGEEAVKSFVDAINNKEITKDPKNVLDFLYPDESKKEEKKDTQQAATALAAETQQAATQVA